MSKNFILHYKSNLKQFIRLTAHIYQYKVNNMILLPKNKIFMFSFPDLEILDNFKK